MKVLAGILFAVVSAATDGAPACDIKLKLWDATSGTDLGPLPAIVDRCSTEFSPLNIETVLEGCDDIDSVGFKLVSKNTGEVLIEQQEGTAPYFLGGDVQGPPFVINATPELEKAGLYHLFTTISPGNITYEAEFEINGFVNTEEILNTQLDDLTGSLTEYVVCPGTTIQVGYPTDETNSNFAYGQFPLVATKPGLTFKCGYDGSSKNMCTLQDGFIQIVAFSALPQFNVAPFPLDGITFKGFTLTGNTGLPPPLDGFGGSVVLAGFIMEKPVVFEDIVAEDITSTDSFFTINQLDSGFGSAFAPGSLSVVLRKSVVRNVSVRREAFMTIAQSMTIETTKIKNIETRENHFMFMADTGGTMTVQNSCFYGNFTSGGSTAGAVAFLNATFPDTTTAFIVNNNYMAPTCTFSEGVPYSRQEVCKPPTTVIDTRLGNGRNDGCLPMLFTSGKCLINKPRLAERRSNPFPVYTFAQQYIPQ